MTKDYASIRVDKAAKSVADDARAEDETWSDYMRRCADADPSVQRLVDADALVAELESDIAAPVADALVAELNSDVANLVADALVAELESDVADLVADALVAELESDVAVFVADRLSGDATGNTTHGDGNVSLDAAERRAIAEEVAEVLR